MGVGRARLQTLGFYFATGYFNSYRLVLAFCAGQAESGGTVVGYYNFIKIHRTLRTSPAMAAGVTVALWEAYEQRRAERAA
jgi:hypothetical protein